MEGLIFGILRYPERGIIVAAKEEKAELAKSVAKERQLTSSTPQETRESDKVNDSPTVPITVTNLSTLNSEAPEWQGIKWCPFPNVMQTQRDINQAPPQCQ